jgi:DNA-binding CsgD family transcriptional regulator
MAKFRTPQLPNGFDKDNIEFFSTEKFKCSFCQNCNIFCYIDTPQSLRDLIQIELIKDTNAVHILRSFPELKTADEIEEAFVSCRYGNYDSIPDFAEGFLTPDCPDCGVEETCPGFGIICKIPTVKRGVLTAREYQIVKLISKGYYDKEIADDLDISINTAQKHLDNIRIKMNFNSRLDIAFWAKDHNI